MLELLFCIFLFSTILVLLFLVKYKNIHRYLYFIIFQSSIILFFFNYKGIYSNSEFLYLKLISISGIIIIFTLIYYFLNEIIFKESNILHKESDRTEMKKLDLLYGISISIVIANFFNMLYSWKYLINERGISLIALYLLDPYWLELNFSPNPILGNFYKFNMVSLFMLFFLKIKGYKNRFLNFFIFLSVIIMLAPNRKGELIVASFAFMIMMFELKKVKLKKIITVILVILLITVFIFYLTYSFYLTAGVEIDIFETMYIYITSPPVVFALNMEITPTYEKQLSEFRILVNIFDKLDFFIDKYEIKKKYGDFFSLHGTNLGNAGTLFLNPYLDMGIWGILSYLFYINFLIFIIRIFSYKNFYFFIFYVFLLAILSMAFFGNYFSNALFLEFIAGLIFFSIIEKIIGFFALSVRNND